MNTTISDSQIRVRAVLSSSSPIRKLADEVWQTVGDDLEAFAVAFERSLVRDIVYREHEIENTIRDLYNNLTDHTAKTDKKLIFNYAEDDIVKQGAYFKAVIRVTENVLGLLAERRPYDQAIQHLKHEASYNLIDYKPQNDGVDHINVYSKGKTRLGVLASNFAHTPFKHPEHGHFASMEGFWYWLMLNKQFNDLRSLYGYRAKQYGIAKRAEASAAVLDTNTAEFRMEIKKALLCKFEQHDETRELLRESTLPLIHYYFWGESPENYRITYPRNQIWITDYITLIRDYLNKKANKVLIFGSRAMNHPDMIESVIHTHGIKAVEFVVNSTRGTGKAGITVAKKLEIPYTVLQPDWEKDGNRAGHINYHLLTDYTSMAIIDNEDNDIYTVEVMEMLDSKDKPKIVIAK